VLRVEGNRYWSYLCPSPLCCPPEGVSFDIEGHPVSVAFTVASGQQVLGSRDDLAATIAPVTGPVAEAMRRETARAQRIAARLIARAATNGSSARPVIQHGRKAVQAAITTYQDGGTIELAGQFAWLSVALSSLWVRDDAWARMDPGHAPAHQGLWADLTRHAQPGYVAAPACLLAFDTGRTVTAQPARPGICENFLYGFQGRTFGGARRDGLPGNSTARHRGSARTGDQLEAGQGRRVLAVTGRQHTAAHSGRRPCGAASCRAPPPGTTPAPIARRNFPGCRASKAGQAVLLAPGDPVAAPIRRTEKHRLGS